MRDALAEVDARCPGMIVRFGGHAAAAGLSLALEHLQRFSAEFDAVARSRLDADLLERVLWSDGELDAADLCFEVAIALRYAGPWGQAFPEPCFDGVFTIRSSRVVGERHLKMWVEVSRTGRSFDAIAFNYVEESANFVRPEGDVQLVYRLDVNEYQGERRLQLLVDHILPSV